MQPIDRLTLDASLDNARRDRTAAIAETIARDDAVFEPIRSTFDVSGQPFVIEAASKPDAITRQYFTPVLERVGAGVVLLEASAECVLLVSASAKNGLRASCEYNVASQKYAPVTGITVLSGGIITERPRTVVVPPGQRLVISGDLETAVRLTVDLLLSVPV